MITKRTKINIQRTIKTLPRISSGIARTTKSSTTQRILVKPPQLFSVDFTTYNSGSLSNIPFPLQFSCNLTNRTVRIGSGSIIIGIGANSGSIGRRIETDSFGFVLEESRINDLYPTDASLSVTWGKSDATVTTILGPDGVTNNAYNVTDTSLANNGFAFPSNGGSFALSQSVCDSCYYRDISGSAGTGMAFNYNGFIAGGPGVVQRILTRPQPTNWTLTSNNYWTKTSGGTVFVPSSTASTTGSAGYACLQKENGNFVTEWIPTNTGAVTRPGARLFSEVRSYFIDQDGSINLELRLIPKGSSGSYAANMRLVTMGPADYVEISNTTAKASFVLNGSTYTTASPISFNQYDVLDLWIKAGGTGVSNIQYRTAITGSVISLSGSAQGQISNSGTIDILSNASTNQFTSWIQKIKFYKSGDKPSWVVN
jgi:hypothetical protein